MRSIIGFISSVVALGHASEKGRPVFGHDLLHHFLLAENYTCLNHGSYGAPPLEVLQAEHRWQLQMERNPDYWFRYTTPDALLGSLDSVRSQVATFIGAQPLDVVFVDGASGGMNAVFRSIRLKPDEALLYLNVAYEMVKNTAEYINKHDRQGILLQVDIRIPSTEDEMVAVLEDALKKHPEVRLASFSHITSTPGIILPVKKFVEVCHRHGVLVVIDGAHAVGQIPINVTDIGSDFYVSNGHKWLYAPKGSGLIWARPETQDLLFPNVINLEGGGSTPFQSRFSYTGTKDYSAFLAMSAAIEFRDRVLGGNEAIMGYMHDLAVHGGDLLAERWGTERLVDEAFIGALVDVRLPDLVATDPCCKNTPAPGLSGMLLEHYGTWVPVFPWNDKCYMRVSAQVYNELSDFEMLASAVLDILSSGCPEQQSSEMLAIWT